MVDNLVCVPLPVLLVLVTFGRNDGECGSENWTVVLGEKHLDTGRPSPCLDTVCIIHVDGPVDLDPEGLDFSEWYFVEELP